MFIAINKEYLMHFIFHLNKNISEVVKMIYASYDKKKKYNRLHLEFLKV